MATNHSRITLLCNLNLSFSFQLLHIRFLAYKCRQLSYLFNPFSLCPCFFSDFFNLFSLLVCFAFLPIFSYIFLFSHSHPLPVSLSLALIHRLANHNLCHIRDAWIIWNSSRMTSTPLASDQVLRCAGGPTCLTRGGRPSAWGWSSTVPPPPARQTRRSLNKIGSF